MTVQLAQLFTGLDLDRADPTAPYRGLRVLQSRLGDRQPLLRDPGRLRPVLEHSAVADPRLFFVMLLHHCVATGPALDHGASERDVAELVSARGIGAALMNESGHGNSASRIRTVAVYAPATCEFILTTPVPTAVKHPASVALPGFARLAVVSARLLVGGLDRGTSLFLVALQDDNGPCTGVTIMPHSGVAPVPMDFASVRFDQVRVPYERWLSDGASIGADGRYDDPLPDPDARSRRAVSMGRFAWGGVSVGLAAAARSSVAIALTRARHRETLDRLGGQVTAINHLNVQRLLFGALAAALAATVIARRASDRCWHIPPGGGRGIGPSDTEMLAMSLNKVTVSGLADTAVARARSACGAAGFFAEHRMIGYQALTMTFQSAGGDNRLILLNAAWAMATGPQYVPPDDSMQDYWIRLVRARERILHAELTTDLRPTFEAWNARTELAQRFAQAHAARIAIEALREAWSASDPLLAELYRLHCLEQISDDAGWFLAHGLVSAAEVLALPKRVNEICRRLVPRVDELVAALEIPAELLHGPSETAEFLLGT